MFFKKAKKFRVSISQYLIVICVLFTRLIQQKFLVHYYKLLLSHKSREKKYSNYLLRFLLLQFGMFNCVEKGNFSVSLQYEIVFANKLSWEKPCTICIINVPVPPYILLGTRGGPHKLAAIIMWPGLRNSSQIIDEDVLKV